MAQIRHQDPLDLIDEIFTDAKERGIMYLVADAETPIERHVKIDGRDLLNFGSCGYMSLGQDERLKRAAVAYVEKFGLQFSVSRGYLSSGINENLEAQLSKIYDNKPVLVYSSTSACHISILPTLLRAKDAIILDQNVHFSVQNAAQIVRAKGVSVDMIRHSSLDMLEAKLQEMGNKVKNVWYLIDGVYSMYGDVAPMKRLHELMDRYEQLHLYIDDAHGMSWYGKHGAGRVYGEFGMHSRTVLCTTLAKGFGCVGGVAVFPDAEMRRKVKLFGGPYSYSHPLSPPVTGASIACTRIHLSEEIVTMQKQLEANIQLCSQMLEEYKIPLLSSPDTPIKFVCMGTPRLCMNVVKRMLDDGYYCSLSTFPVVPVKNTGLRFTIQRQLRPDDIKQFVSVLARNFRAGLKEEGIQEDELREHFNLPTRGTPSEASRPVAPQAQPEATTLQHATTITAFDAQEWDRLLGGEGIFDVNGLKSFEAAFGKQAKPEEHWDFDYYIVRDRAGKPLLATFFTTSLYKDDIFAHPSISDQIEQKRKYVPMYLTSRTMAMGCLLSEGQHLYIDRGNPEWVSVLRGFLKHVTARQEERGARSLLLRDFDANDKAMQAALVDEGFVRIEMPLSNTIEKMTWTNQEEFMEWLPSTRRRRHVRQDILPHIDKYEVEVKSELSAEEQQWAYDLYMNVKNRNTALNVFAYPPDIVRTLSKHDRWEFIILRLKAPHDTRAQRLPVGIGWCYRGLTAYSWMVQGINYDFNNDFKVYRQCMYQMVLRAKALGYDRIYMGLSADEEKKKVGAQQTEKVAYHQTKDTFAMDVMSAMAASSQ